MEAKPPANERERLAALRRYQVLDSPFEVAFDRLTAMAAQIFGVPIALVSLIDENRQWFKACYGVDMRESDRKLALCAHALHSTQVLVARDTLQDERFADHPLVVNPPNVRFYAGAPLVSPEGMILGTLCLVDLRPREFSEEQTKLLASLAAAVMSELEHRLAGQKLVEEVARSHEIEAQLEARVAERTRDLATSNAALREAEAKAREMIEHAVEGVFQTTPEGRYLSANQALATMYGYSSVQEMLKEVSSIEGQIYVEPGRRAEFVRLMEEHGELKVFESEVHRRDGRNIWISETARTVRDPQGRVLYYEGMVKDISARKAAERALGDQRTMLEILVRERTGDLERSNQDLRDEIAERQRVESALHLAAVENSRLTKAIQSSDVGLLISDPTQPDAPTIFVNAAFERITGYPAAEVMGRNCRFLQGPETDPEMVRQIREAVARQQPFRGLILNYHRNGTPFWNELIIDPVFDEKGALVNFIGLQNDVTERKRYESALRESKEEAERANQAKSEFLSRMSHELRTPLNAILGFSQLLQMQPLAPSDAENVEFIGKAGHHLLDLINEVLDLARIEAGKVVLQPEPVPVRAIVGEVVALVRGESARRGLLVGLVEPCGEGWHVMADRQRLKQILLNLLSNAVKYNRQGGSITVSCDKDELCRLSIRVKDTGPGIPAELQARLFNPFDRLGAEYSQVEGTGIGLAISQRLARLQGGDIEVASLPGQGSTFSLRMPMVPGRVDPVVTEVRRTIASVGEPAGIHRLRVLYVEDNAANLELMQKIVAKHPRWQLTAARDGEEGVRVAFQLRPELILLDLHLPELSGEAVLQRIRETPEISEIPVVIVSADAMSQQVRRLLSAGANAYLTKPIDVGEVLQLLDTYAQTVVADNAP